MLLLLHVTFNSFQICPECSCQWFSQTTLGIFFIEFLIFNDFFFFFENFKFVIVPYGETKNLNYLENESSESKTELNLGLADSSSTNMGYL